MESKYKINQFVTFRLDNRWDGQGTIKAIGIRAVEVNLTKACKEFEEGDTITVYYDEILTVS